MNRKDIAINEACKAFEKLCRYKGIFCDIDSDFYISKNQTIANINKVTENLLAEIGKPLPIATEKQISYLLSLAKRNEDGFLFEGVKLNKYQASQLIQIYKYLEDLYYSKYPISYCKETYAEIDKRINYILSIKTI